MNYPTLPATIKPQTPALSYRLRAAWRILCGRPQLDPAAADRIASTVMDSLKKAGAPPAAAPLPRPTPDQVKEALRQSPERPSYALVAVHCSPTLQPIEHRGMDAGALGLRVSCAFSLWDGDDMETLTNSYLERCVNDDPSLKACKLLTCQAIPLNIPRLIVSRPPVPENSEETGRFHSVMPFFAASAASPDKFLEFIADLSGFVGSGLANLPEEFIAAALDQLATPAPPDPTALDPDYLAALRAWLFAERTYVLKLRAEDEQAAPTH